MGYLIQLHLLLVTQGSTPCWHCLEINHYILLHTSIVVWLWVFIVLINLIPYLFNNLSLAWIRLLIEGGSYLRVAFINFGLILDGVIHENYTTEDWLMKTAFWVIEICHQRSSHAAVESIQGCLLPCLGPELAITFQLQSWPHHLIEFTQGSYYSNKYRNHTYIKLGHTFH